MEWWQQLGFDSEAEAIARGESEEVFNRTRNITPNTTSMMDAETAAIKEFVGSQKVDDDTSVIPDNTETPSKYIIVQGPDGRYTSQQDAAGTYTDANVQAEIDRLNTQRDATLLSNKSSGGGSGSDGGGGVYTPRTSTVDYTPVETTGLSTREEAKLRFPYLDERLIDVYVQGFVDNGDSQLAILQMRSDP